jgi:putative aldouronate transport system permease protein
MLSLRPTNNPTACPIKKRRSGTLLKDLKRDIFLYLLLLLPMSYFIIFKYLPMYGVVIAFQDFNLFQGVFHSQWIGFQCFQEIFQMQNFYNVLRNTLVLNFLDLIFGFPAPIILALILNELRIMWFKKVSQTILYLPHFLSWVIIGGVAYQIFQNDGGLINDVIRSMGLQTIPFLTNQYCWIVVYVLVGIWQSSGWGTILYLAAIACIDSALYEAAEVDGASRMQRIWHITLPGLKATAVMLLILNVGNIVNISFDRPYVMGNSVVQNVSDVISTFVYRIGLGSGRFNIATAVGLFQSVIGVVFLLVTNFLAEKIDEQGIW